MNSIGMNATHMTAPAYSLAVSRPPR